MVNQDVNCRNILESENQNILVIYVNDNEKNLQKISNI